MPFATDLLTNEDDKLLMQAASAPQALGRPLLLPPDVPADRVAAMRKALADTFNDAAVPGRCREDRPDRQRAANRPAIAGGDRARLCVADACGRAYPQAQQSGELMLQTTNAKKAAAGPLARGNAPPRRGAGAGAAGARGAMRDRCAAARTRPSATISTNDLLRICQPGALRRLRARLRRAVRGEPDARARLRLAGLGAHGARRQHRSSSRPTPRRRRRRCGARTRPRSCRTA